MLHARVHGRAVAFGSNDQRKCFDLFLQGVQLLLLRLFHHPGPVSPDPTATDTRPHAGRAARPPQTRAEAFHEYVMQHSVLRTALPGTNGVVGPPTPMTRSAAQGLTVGPAFGNLFGEVDIRLVKRVHQTEAEYYWGTPGDAHAAEFLNPETCRHYCDDNHNCAGDTAERRAEEHMVDIVGGTVPYCLEALGQSIDFSKSWILHQRAGAPCPHEYRAHDGSAITDAALVPHFKSLGFFFSTDARDD